MEINVVDEKVFNNTSGRGRKGGWPTTIREAAKASITKCVSVKLSDIPCERYSVGNRITAYHPQFKARLNGDCVLVKYVGGADSLIAAMIGKGVLEVVPVESLTK
jgi:hypothetical protein